jgi:hypothetical protein
VLCLDYHSNNALLATGWNDRFARVYIAVPCVGAGAGATNAVEWHHYAMLTGASGEVDHVSWSKRSADTPLSVCCGDTGPGHRSLSHRLLTTCDDGSIRLYSISASAVQSVREGVVRYRTARCAELARTSGALAPLPPLMAPPTPAPTPTASIAPSLPPTYPLNPLPPSTAAASASAYSSSTASSSSLAVSNYPAASSASAPSLFTSQPSSAPSLSAAPPLPPRLFSLGGAQPMRSPPLFNPSLPPAPGSLPPPPLTMKLPRFIPQAPAPLPPLLPPPPPPPVLLSPTHTFSVPFATLKRAAWSCAEHWIIAACAETEDGPDIDEESGLNSEPARAASAAVYAASSSHAAARHSPAASASSSAAASASVAACRHSIRLFSPSTGACTHTLVFHTDALIVIAPHPLQECVLASAGKDGRVAVWEVEPKGGGRVLRSFVVGAMNTVGWVGDLCWSGDGCMHPDLSLLCPPPLLLLSSYCLVHVLCFVIVVWRLAFLLATTDSGFLALYHTGHSRALYHLTPAHQFFVTDYRPLNYDSAGWCVDRELGVSDHLIVAPKCDADGRCALFVLKGAGDN